MAKIIVNDGEGESEFALSESGATIGRVAKHCEIVIKVPEASREHCRIKFESGSWFVEDLGSSNGTRVNGRKVTTFELQDGDQISVGKATLRFLESDVVVEEISLADEGELDLEISLEEEVYLRFLNTHRVGEKIPFAGRMTFGRRSTNAVTLNEKGVSGNHTEFVSEGGTWVSRDLGSTNGTIVNGESSVETRLAAGDRVRIGTVEFVFGVGEDEGDDDLVATVTLEEVPLEDEIFAISEANMKRKQKAATVVWLVLIVAVAGAGGWWVTQETSKSSKTKVTKAINGNQLAADGNFEARENDDDYLSTDSDAVDYVETRKRKASGERALEVKVSDGDGDHYLAFTREIENISTSDRIEVGGQIRTSGVTGGGVGFSLLWKNESGRILGVSHVNAPMGESNFRQVSAIFMPPLGAESAAVAIGFHDATGKLIVDDVFALRSRGGGKTIKAHGYDLLLDSSGSLNVSRDGAEILDHGGLYEFTGNAPQFLGRLFAAEESKGNEQSQMVKGFLSAGEGGDAEFSAKVGGNGITWTGSLAGAAKLSLGFQVDPLDGLVTVNSEGAMRHTEAFKRDGVTELVVATGPRALRFVFAQPESVEMTMTNRGAIILLPSATSMADGRRSFALDIQMNFDAELGEVNALNGKARDADIVRKKYGEAMGYYSEIVNRYSFRKEVSDRAANRLVELRLKAEKALVRLRKEVDDVLFFQTFEQDRARVSEELQRFIDGFATSSFEEKFRVAKTRLDGAWNDISEKRRLATAENHLLRGRDLMTPGNSAPVLARGFFLSVVELAPGGQLAEAATEELKKIETLLGSK